VSEQSNDIETPKALRGEMYVGRGADCGQDRFIKRFPDITVAHNQRSQRPIVGIAFASRKKIPETKHDIVQVGVLH